MMLSILNRTTRSTGILAIVLLFSSVLWSQQDHPNTPCATPGDYPEWLKQYLANPSRPQARNADEPVYLPITFHTVGTDQGEGHYSTIKIHESLCRLNIDFAPYNIQFYLKYDINKINRSRYYEHNDFPEGQKMMSSYKRSLTINAFITKTAPNGACGYFHPSSDGIVVVKKCMGGTGHTLTHEVGHWLSLPHTFAGWEGVTFDASKPTPEFLKVSGRDTTFVESVAGKNCDRAGDGFCDTPPDYLSEGWSCNGQFQSEDIQIDPDGIDFRSDGKNYMSYSRDLCQSEFSPMQVDAMRAYIDFSKRYYKEESAKYGPVATDAIVPVYPLVNDKVGHEGIRLEWEHHPNATHYLINVSRFSFFVDIDYEFVVESNHITVDLPVDKKWYWRIKPYNQNDVCAAFTDAGGFTTYDVTAVEEIQSNNFLDVYPNIITSTNRNINIDFQFNDILTTQVQLFSLAGNLVHERILPNPGKQIYRMSVPSLTAGFYFLRITTERGQLVKRLAVQ